MSSCDSSRPYGKAFFSRESLTSRSIFNTMSKFYVFEKSLDDEEGLTRPTVALTRCTLNYSGTLT